MTNIEFNGIFSFNTAEELIGIFDAEYKGVPGGLTFEQGGYLEEQGKGWKLYLPHKSIRVKESNYIGRFSDINFGFYGMNRKGEEGILLKVSEKIKQYPESVLKQGLNINDGKLVLQTMFFTVDEIILHNGENFAEFILKLGHNSDMAKLNAKELKAMLADAKYVEPEIDNISGDITDEYKYVPLVLEIEVLESPREIIHGKNWSDANRTNKYVHTHVPTNSDWNDLIRSKLHDSRDELNTPPDILGLRHDIARLNAPKGASSSIATFEYDMSPRSLRTFVLAQLNVAEGNELIALAVKHRMTLNKQPNNCKKDELLEIIRFYDLVKKATVNGLPRTIK